MKAQIKFLRLDAETAEEELVFEVIPDREDGVYPKNRWLLRVAKCFVDEQAGGGSTLNEQIDEATKLIGAAMGIEHHVR